MAPREYDYDRALSYTLWLLGRRDYSEKELRDRLTRKGAGAADIDRVIARLDDLDLVDDARVAAGLVRVRRKKRGVFALRRELRRKGIVGSTAEDALAPVTHESQLAAALRILERHAWRFEDRDARSRARAYAFLARRGFPPDVVREALGASERFDEDGGSRE